MFAARLGFMLDDARRGAKEARCVCAEPRHECGLVVLTGGPGAGKTAVLEVVRRAFCAHIAVLPEAATILFGGGFPRHDTEPGRRAAQDAIFHVQRAMETISRDEHHVALALCDRGTLDGLAYWPGGVDAACAALRVRREEELARYRAVIHLRTPSARDGYDHSNPVRRESAAEAAALDDRILAAWAGHPRRIVVESEHDFLRKLARAVAAIRSEVPECCRAHPIAELGEAPRAHVGCGGSEDCAPAAPEPREL
jgi:predicted ATPase